MFGFSINWVLSGSREHKTESYKFNIIDADADINLPVVVVELLAYATFSTQKI